MMPQPLPDDIRVMLKGRRPVNPDILLIRIRDADKPYGTGAGVQFKSDEFSDPNYQSALDKVAMFIQLTNEFDAARGTL